MEFCWEFQGFFLVFPFSGDLSVWVIFFFSF